MPRAMIVLAILTVAVFVCAIGYIYLNRKNRYVWEIILGSIAIGLFIGIMPKLINSLFEKSTVISSVILLTIVLACLTVLIAILVYLSNIPKSIRREIPVMYLLSPRKKELPYGLRFPDTTTLGCYNDARWIFKRFKEMNPVNAKNIEGLTKTSGSQNFAFATKCFLNLTEYLLVYYMANHFTTPEVDLAMYRKEIPKWLGWPHKNIADKPRPLETIDGDFRSNIFYGIKGNFPEAKLELRFPKGTELTLRRGNISSTLTIKNKYMVAKIGIFFSIMGSQSSGFLRESALLAYGSDKEELAKAFRRFLSIIYYDVTFSKWRYGYPKMKYYEKWADDLFRVLQKKFRWGSLLLADETGVLSRYLPPKEKGEKQ